MIAPLPRSTLFPYTTLFRSIRRGVAQKGIDLGGCGWQSRKVKSYAADQSSLVGLRRRREAFTLKACQNERSEEHTSELQSHSDLVCRLLLEKKKIELKLPAT